MKATDILKKEVKVMSENQVLAVVFDVISDAKKPKIKYFVIKKEWWSQDRLLVKWENVVKFENNVLWLGTENLLGINGREARVEYKDNRLLLGRRALTLSGTNIGRVGDVEFDLTTGGIVDYEIEKGFGFWKNKRWIKSRYFVEINDRGVIFSDEVDKMKMKKIVEMEMVHG